MALDKNALKAAIAAAFKTQASKTENPDDALVDLAGQIADAVDIFVKSVTITYTVGLVSPSGPVTGAFTYTIS